MVASSSLIVLHTSRYLRHLRAKASGPTRVARTLFSFFFVAGCFFVSGEKGVVFLCKTSLISHLVLSPSTSLAQKIGVSDGTLDTEYEDCKQRFDRTIRELGELSQGMGAFLDKSKDLFGVGMDLGGTVYEYYWGRLMMDWYVRGDLRGMYAPIPLSDFVSSPCSGPLARPMPFAPTPPPRNTSRPGRTATKRCVGLWPRCGSIRV